MLLLVSASGGGWVAVLYGQAGRSLVPEEGGPGDQEGASRRQVEMGQGEATSCPQAIGSPSEQAR